MGYYFRTTPKVLFQKLLDVRSGCYDFRHGRVETNYKPIRDAVLFTRSSAACLDCARPGRSYCFWNKGAERLYGWRADEVTGENVYELLFPRELQGIEEKERVLAETGEWAGELRQVTKTQTTIVVESRWKLRRDESGKPKSVLMVNKDITRTRKLEGELLRAQRIETAGRLTTSIAHDLNNVLSAMLISMRALSQEQIDPAHRDALKVSQLCVEQAAQSCDTFSASL